jgi:SWI/SNF-related matrix-associated actin-dependent regulator 1 of chromatin subfamily A
MKITFWKGVFVADALPEDHGMLKKGGFVAHEPTLCEDPSRCKACRANIGRRFWSARVEDATRLRTYCNDRALSVMKEHLAKLEKSRAISSNLHVPAPSGLEYLPYQKAGIAYAIQRKDTLIGDEAGLGKTVVSLGFINYTRPKTVLVVAPATLAFNWKLEAEKWLIDPYTIFIPQDGSDTIPEPGPNGRLLVITNYEKVVAGTRRKPCPRCCGVEVPGYQCAECSGTGKIKILNCESDFLRGLKRTWDLSIYDEVQALKNPASKRSQAVLGEFGLFNRSHRTLSLSGTPIENYPKEIWALAATICPAKFGDWWAFARRYCGLHEEIHRDRKVIVTTGHSHLSELQQRLRASFMVRRLKHDVLKELPPKRRQLVILGDQEVDWSTHPEFRRWKELYERDYEAAMSRIEAAETLREYKLAVKDLEAFVGVAFTEMSEFRHKTALVKLPLCLRYIDDLLANGLDNVVIFAHHKDVLEKIYSHYKKDAVMLYGGTPMEKRGEIVQEFQNGPKRVFVGGLKAAGTGITLTKASTVIFIEIDWVPATLSQAEDRLCRIGQKKMVHVIHLVLNNTLDVNMSQKVMAKQEVIDKALDRLPEHIRMKQTSLPLVLSNK